MFCHDFTVHEINVNFVIRNQSFIFLSCDFANATGDIIVPKTLFRLACIQIFGFHILCKIPRIFYDNTASSTIPLR